MQFQDALTLDAPARTSEGYLKVRARAARTGVYDYAGHEVDPQNKHGLRDAATVKVLRDERTVFDTASAQSFIGKPITNDHPSVAVGADNWRDHARGVVMGAMRDGEYLAFDLLFTDASAIASLDSGKRELSNGYGAELEFGSFTATDGTACQARQVSIRGNHVALVDAGRAGPNCAVRDAQKFALCDANAALVAALTTGNTMKTITLDGLPVNLGDAAAVEAAINKLNGKLADAETKLADAQAQISTLTGEKTALAGKLADADGKLAPAVLDKLVADRAALVAQAKTAAPDLALDGKTDAEIRRAVVEAKLGDAGKALDDAAIPGAFAVLTATDNKVVSITPAASITNDSASVRDLARAARY